MNHDSMETQIRGLSQEEIKRAYSLFFEQLEEEAEVLSEQEILDQYDQNRFILETYADQYIDARGQEAVNDDILYQILEGFADCSETFRDQIQGIIREVKDKSITLSLPVSDFAVNIIMVSVAIAMLKPHIYYEKRSMKDKETVKFELKTEPAEKLNEIISLILGYIKK